MGRDHVVDRRSFEVVNALLFAADREEHCNGEILPHLRDGYIVISDRYKWSSYAYQSIHTGFTFLEEFYWLVEVNKKAIDPDLTIVLTMPLDKFEERVGTGRDLYEQADTMERVKDAYDKLAHYMPNKSVVIDASANRTTVFSSVYEAIKELVRLRGMLRYE